MTQRLGLPDQTAHYETTSCGRAPNAVLTPLARALPKLPFGWTRFKEVIVNPIPSPTCSLPSSLVPSLVRSFRAFSLPLCHNS